MAKTQKNKATSFHLGQLKAKLAKLKRDLLTPTSGGGGGGGGNVYHPFPDPLYSSFLYSRFRCR